jgi:hypothetical protein
MRANGTVIEDATLSPKTIRTDVFNPTSTKTETLIARMAAPTGGSYQPGCDRLGFARWGALQQVVPATLGFSRESRQDAAPTGRFGRAYLMCFRMPSSSSRLL